MISKASFGRLGAGKAKRRLAASALAGLMLLGVGSTGAEASAYGVSYWGAITVNGYPIPSGQLGHTISGSGLTVQSDAASFVSASAICQWWIDFDYWDGSGNRYLHLQGTQNDSCSRTGTVGWKGFPKMRAGIACATLYKRVPNSIAQLTRQCHNIHA